MPCRVRRTYEKTTSASSCDGSGLGPCRIQEPLYHFDIQGIVFVYQYVVIGMQDALPQTGVNWMAALGMAFSGMLLTIAGAFASLKYKEKH